MKILIADNDESLRDLLEASLSAKGYEVFCVDNGEKVLVYLNTQLPDIIVSNILMPELDGYGLCRAIKQNQALAHIPIIFYSATKISDQDKCFALSLGAAKFLIDPLVIDDLINDIEEVTGYEQKNAFNKTCGLNHSAPLKFDKQHVERIKNRLDQKINELNLEKVKLIESEARFRDFAQASAGWFWECDEQLNIRLTSDGPVELNLCNLTDLAEACHSHNASEMLKTLQLREYFMDYAVHYTNATGKPVYLRVSGKPLFMPDGKFIGYRGVGRDISETVALHHRVEYLATHDDLTGLPNRSMFRQRLEYAVNKAAREGSQVLLLYFDLDNFKMVNDTLGHEAGDQLLVMATKRILEQVRSIDILCRLGGDEFVMIMEGASPQDAHRLVRQIIVAFSNSFEVLTQKIYCTLSIGVSVYPDDTKDAKTLLVYADLAMYRAKQNGRNDFEFYTSNLNFIAHQWLEMEHGIRHALNHEQLFLEYQPQVNAVNNKLIGIEALLRWRHPERGLIPPLEFIKIAEQSSLINQIGNWVIEEACKQMRAWLDAGLSLPCVSVNISARQMRSEGLTETLSQTAHKHNILPNMLCIEITEHALLEESEIVKTNMQRIKADGFKISLDDFGMGHSSLLYLKRYSVDEVKIDRAFVEGLVNSEEDRVIVKAIVALADALSLSLIGEGVENQQQASILIASGCKNMQGYFYSPDLSAKEMIAWLKK